MQIVLTNQHLIYLNQQDAMPPALRAYITTEFDALLAALNFDGEKTAFSLDDHGHCMIVLEPSDNYRHLSNVGPGAFELDLLASVPEYVESIPLSDECSVFRLGFLFDNECFLIMYILDDRLDPKLEHWLREQDGQFVEEGLQ